MSDLGYNVKEILSYYLEKIIKIFNLGLGIVNIMRGNLMSELTSEKYNMRREFSRNELLLKVKVQNLIMCLKRNRNKNIYSV